MKILVVGITYMSRINWDKFIAMSALFPDSEIRVVFPHKVVNSLGKNLSGQSGKFNNLEFIPIKAYLSQYETVHFYGLEYLKLIRSFKPDIILVEHGSYSLSLAQTSLYIRMSFSNTKILFFTWWNLPYKLGFLRKVIEWFNFKMVVGAVVGNQDAKDILNARGFLKPIKIIPLLGIDENVYKRTPQPVLRADLKLNDEVILLFAGRIVKEKGISTLLKSVKKLVDSQLKTKWKLLIVGSGAYENEAKKISESFALDDYVKFYPPVDHYEVIKYLSVAEIFILPSETVSYWKEQFGHVIIEAMACENVVVGSDSGEIPNVISDGGIVFQEGRETELASILRKLIENKSFRDEIKIRGKMRVANYYTHKNIACQTFNFFQEMIG